MIEMIDGLISKGRAYESAHSVYFSIDSFPNYNTVFQRNFRSRKAENKPAKLHPKRKVKPVNPLAPIKIDINDFALWKACKSSSEVGWSNPYGVGLGRPGMPMHQNQC
jgi:cysteinyl-tRNA synthetase